MADSTDSPSPVIAEIMRTLFEQNRNQPSPEFSLRGGGGVSNTDFGNILSGGGQLDVDIPINDTLNLLLYISGGGAIGDLKGQDWSEEIRKLELGNVGLGLNLRF